MADYPAQPRWRAIRFDKRGNTEHLGVLSAPDELIAVRHAKQRWGGSTSRGTVTVERIVPQEIPNVLTAPVTDEEAVAVDRMYIPGMPTSK